MSEFFLKRQSFILHFRYASKSARLARRCVRTQVLYHLILQRMPKSPRGRIVPVLEVSEFNYRFTSRFVIQQASPFFGLSRLLANNLRRDDSLFG
jgi:hypothetical protein